MSDASLLKKSNEGDDACRSSARNSRATAASITVAIPTFRRPQSLAYLLRELEGLNTGANVTVLVADNDVEKHEGRDLCEATRISGYRWPLESIIVAERGIAQVRNALVTHFIAKHHADFIAMIDDDEWPSQNWLDEFLREQLRTRADALQGTIRRVFESYPGDWVVHCDGLTDVERPSGPVAILQGAGNLFICREMLQRIKAPWFDDAFAFSGGEDADFFVRLKHQGANFAWAADAVAFDRVPPSRANIKWALNRAYSVGNSDMRVFLKHRPSIGAQIDQAARIVGALLVNPFLFVLLSADRNRRIKPIRKLYRAAGKIAALRGKPYEEYAVVHGQ